ncbi:conserved hypothetical protein [Prochlorococcus marinus str. MIT 9515]|uniref:Uncharacterized protein n=1 Tax=Prochlorococcus marinus (strain MIT 9515) TaxID=167542 RepID=A2BYH3_PROM5|nr:hypothetical protein [Prochlorococcus marinus]ABM72834.1 conserved hypothetical protein [Prochlorococcus marinus str. MIT 9515]
MKLIKVDFYLDWPPSIKVFNLRRFIIGNLMKKGRIIRWSIADIKASVESSHVKKIRIKAVLEKQINSSI